MVQKGVGADIAQGHEDERFLGYRISHPALLEKLWERKRKEIGVDTSCRLCIELCCRKLFLLGTYFTSRSFGLP